MRVARAGAGNGGAQGGLKSRCQWGARLSAKRWRAGRRVMPR